jgi:hypothetical protein
MKMLLTVLVLILFYPYNKLNGHGILVRPNAIKYIGEFKNGNFVEK